MTVTTFYPDQLPDTGPANTSVDGHAGRDSAGEGWAAQRDGAGTASADAGAQPRFGIGTNGSSVWQSCYRSFLLFDTSSIGSDTIDSATMEIVAIGRVNDFSVGQSASMVQSTPATNTALVNADYNQANWPANTKQATDKTLASFTVDSDTYNIFTLTVLTNISKTGVTKFGLRITADNDDLEPTVGASKTAQIEWASAEENLPIGDRRPKLVVTHTATFVPRAVVF